MPESVEQERRKAIQLRVAVVLKYWVETQMNDFDSDLIAKLTQFVNETMHKDGYDKMAKSLNKILQKKVSEAEKKTKLKFSEPITVIIHLSLKLKSFTLFKDSIGWNFTPAADTGH